MVLLASQVPCGQHRTKEDAARVGLGHMWETLNLGNPIFYDGLQAKLPKTLRQREALPLLCWITTKHALCEKAWQYFFQGCFLNKLLWRESKEWKAIIVSAHKTCRNARDPWRIISQQPYIKTNRKISMFPQGKTRCIQTFYHQLSKQEDNKEMPKVRGQLFSM